MGINNLSQLINKDLYEEVPYETFSQKKIAVDAAFIMFRYNMVHENVVKAYINLLTRLRSHNIHPIFVFDGPHPPEKRLETERRQETKAALLAQIESLESDLEAYEQQVADEVLEKVTDGDDDDTTLLDIQTTVIPSDNLLQVYNKHVSSEGTLVPVFRVDVIKNYISKLRQRTFVLKDRDVNLCKEILTMFKVPFEQAPGEAEIYCSKLCKDGHVSAVLGLDTDIMAAGCPVILRELTSSGFRGIFLDNILDDLELTYDQWLDLCILCGTDFNRNIPQVGPKTALNLIRTHKRIEDIPMDTSILNYSRVRELFLTDHLEPCTQHAYIPFLDGGEVHEALRKYNLTYLYNGMRPFIK